MNRSSEMSRLARRTLYTGLAAWVVTNPIALAQDTAPENAPDEIASYLRISEVKDKSIALEIATREFVPADGNGPRVGLVAVAHVGDRAFYQSLQKILSEYDVVLYESVKPAGTGGAGGDTVDERVQSTKAAIEFLASIIEVHHEKTQTYPADYAVLGNFADNIDPRLGQWITTAKRDAWGNEILYTVRDADEAASTYSLVSHGADGKEGGEDEAADLSLADVDPPRPFSQGEEHSIQSDLAEALGLEFQLDAVDYDQPNWQCSDLAIDEVDRRLTAHGLDFDLIGGTLTGSSLPGQIMSFLLRLVKMADRFFEGAIADTIKVVLIELLSDDVIMEQALVQFGEGFTEVIIDDRNQQVIDDLKKVSADDPDVKSVAIFYGAAHMPDMAQRLQEQLNYTPAGEKWFSAIEVDYTKSVIPASELSRIRVMMRRMIRQQFKQMQKATAN